MISYADVRTPRTEDEIRAERIQDLQGISPVTQFGAGGQGSGLGTGSVTASGIAQTNASAVAKIVASGEPNDGIAQWAPSLDGGISFGLAANITSTPTAIPSTGATIAFAAGGAGAGTSFVAGELYAFDIATPVWDATAWQRYSAPRRLLDLEVRAAALEDISIATLAGAGFLRDSSGPWLDLVAGQLYGETRNPAVYAQKWITLTDSAGVGPIVVSPGTLWARDASGQFRYVNLGAGTIPLNGSLALLFQAERSGVGYNLGNGACTALVTPIPGVTVLDQAYISPVISNRGGAPSVTASWTGSPGGSFAVLVQITIGGSRGDVSLQWSIDGGATWTIVGAIGATLALGSTGITLAFATGTYLDTDVYSFTASASSISQAGVDVESDPSLQNRCQNKWPTLSLASGVPSQAWEYWAKKASVQVTRALAYADLTTPGQTDVVLAGPAGGVSPDVVAAANAVLQPRVGTTETCVVSAATGLTIALAGVVYVKSGTSAIAQAAALIALNEYFAACPIGGYKLGGGASGMSVDELIGCLVKGSQDSPVTSSAGCNLTSPSADVALVVPQVPVLDASGLTWTEV